MLGEADETDFMRTLFHEGPALWELRGKELLVCGTPVVFKGHLRDMQALFVVEPFKAGESDESDDEDS